MTGYQFFMPHSVCGQTRHISPSNTRAPSRARSTSRSSVLRLVRLSLGGGGPSILRNSPMLVASHQRKPNRSRLLSHEVVMSTKAASIGGSLAAILGSNSAAISTTPVYRPCDTTVTSPARKYEIRT